VGEDEHGNPKLDVVEGTFEQMYRVGNHHSVALFLALSRAKGLLPYRRARQHEGTLCVRAALAEHDALWSEFLELVRMTRAGHSCVRQPSLKNRDQSTINLRDQAHRQAPSAPLRDPLIFSSRIWNFA
jgi:hypothetical protein